MIIKVCVALQLQVRYQLKCDDSFKNVVWWHVLVYTEKRDTAIIKKFNYRYTSMYS